ncbi:MAG: rhomboid family intramembrane serine protease [Ignavibacteriaceae bacterium]|jgi:Uncharacterized membrane protein (homolog of Drosophila rhomboid)|nr:MAG: rhomboid family intramembrane serine protease [Chlorobiota bacterium]KXK03840.1 MAG: rhomboid family protein [Chlorobi bacterium OLB4]MBV6398203.1 hypothetical protein [Ignavibacteria bacterium]MCC6885884.1 rhomboid family intramembrane serine protease [Ignavibacteriales bacterium]MCE7953459.1 rhomboid family intramembrane serine protease [Chlorobi bacterium CHB7]MDL1887395.1 rhomboid family intramembrane serine protease [Ignavibacteria bacterium CHB1]MEB2330043.1 rhomboid family intr
MNLIPAQFSITDTPVTITFVIANVFIYLATNPGKNTQYFYEFAEWPYKIVNNGKYYQLLTSAFLHGSAMHLIFNMFALFTFGGSLELYFKGLFDGFIGSLYYAIIYFVSLFSGSLLSVALHYKNPDYVGVGASGAVSGIVFSYIIFFPANTIYVFFFPMPAFIFAILWIGFSLYGMKKNLGNIGHEAHLGGAIGGSVTTLLLIDGAFNQLIGYFTA